MVTSFFDCAILLIDFSDTLLSPRISLVVPEFERGFFCDVADGEIGGKSSSLVMSKVTCCTLDGSDPLLVFLRFGGAVLLARGFVLRSLTICLTLSSPSLSLRLIVEREYCLH